MFDLEDNEIFQEAKLTTKERDKLPSSEFGIPEERAFPLNDEEHIRAAVSMFPHAAKQYKPGLAQRILTKAKKLGIDTNGWDSLKAYVNECDAVQEGFFVAGFGNLRTRIANYLGDKFTVSHVKKPMAASEMFDIKNNENTDTVVKVEGTGTGVKITAKTGFEVERFGSNVPLSNAFKKLISVIDSLFPGQVVTESVVYQEGAWNDIKNGVNPLSKTRVFHVSANKSLDGRVFQPRVPSYLEPYDSLSKNFENDTTARISFSNSIEKALNALFVTITKNDPIKFNREMYVYTPDKPLNDYKYKTTKELIRDKEVYDANVTNEIWILEPVKLRLFGVIKVNKIRNVTRKKTTPNIDNESTTRPYYSYDWSWVVPPRAAEKLIQSSTETLLYDLSLELLNAVYGLIKDGKVQTSYTQTDIEKYWRFNSKFEDGFTGGICYDFTEYEAEYCKDYDIQYNKYYISMTDDNDALFTHSFIVARDGSSYWYIEAAFHEVANKMINNMKKFSSLTDIFDFIVSEMTEYYRLNNYQFGIFDYTKCDIPEGSTIKEFQSIVTSKGTTVYDGDEAKIKTVQEGYNAEDRSPTGSGLDKNFNRGLFYMNMKTGELIAPNGSAHGTVKRGNDYWVPIDEMMAPVAYICNKKGYTTSDCCQGHPACIRIIEDNTIKNTTGVGSTPYIGIIGKHNFKNLPHGWYQGSYGTPENPRTSIGLIEIDCPSGTNIDTRKYTEYYNKITKAISDLCKYFEKLPPLGQNNETPIKEAYVMGDRSIDNFRYLMESANEKEDIDTDDEDLNEDNIDQLNDGDDDGVEVSVSTTKFTMPTDSDQQNDYDPRDVERLNKLIAAESDAINDYFDATKDSNDETLRRLYGDIGHEERFHLEQLLYAKSTITGEKYEPRDPEVKKEYEELLAMGMDEDTAMSTAFDKRSMAQEDDDSDDLDDEQEDAEVLEFAVSNFVASEELLETLHTVRTPSLQKSIDTFMEAYLIQEGIDNVAAKAPSVATANNVARNNGPIRMIFNGLKAIIRFVKKLAQNVKITCKKLLTRQKRIHQFIKQNGISGIFANGVSLYFYNDKNCTYMDAALQYVDMCDRLTGIIANNVNMRNEWQHIAVLPSNVNPITFGNFDNGISILKGVVLTKTKVVVTQDNKGKLAELFFGYTEQPANSQTGQSGNIMFKIQKITDVTANYLDRVEKFMGKLQTAHDDPANGGRMNQFNEAIKSMGIIKNSIQKFVKALTFDNNEIIKLDNGILNDTKTKDAARAQQPTQQQP